MPVLCVLREEVEEELPNMPPPPAPLALLLPFLLVAFDEPNKAPPPAPLERREDPKALTGADGPSGDVKVFRSASTLRVELGVKDLGVLVSGFLLRVEGRRLKVEG